jgi:hypothetical protein
MVLVVLTAAVFAAWMLGFAAGLIVRVVFGR